MVLVQDQVDALADVFGHRDLGFVVQQLELLVLLFGDVNGGGDFLAGHFYSFTITCGVIFSFSSMVLAKVSAAFSSPKFPMFTRYHLPRSGMSSTERKAI